MLLTKRKRYAIIILVGTHKPFEDLGRYGNYCNFPGNVRRNILAYFNEKELKFCLKFFDFSINIF